MTKVRVNLRARVLPSTHQIFIARPGRKTRLYDEFVRQRVVGPDLPFLDLESGIVLDRQDDLEGRIKRSVRLRNWHDRRRPEHDQPSRNLEDYSDGINARSMAQYKHIVEGYFSLAQKGDFAVLIPRAQTKFSTVAEFTKNPEIIRDAIIDRYYPGDPISARSIKILNQIRKRDLPNEVIEITSKPNAFVIAPRSLRSRLYQDSLASFAYDGSFSARFDTTSDKYTTGHDFLLLAFVNFVTKNTMATSLESSHNVSGIREAAFQDLGQMYPDLRSNVNSPGSLNMGSPYIILSRLRHVQPRDFGRRRRSDRCRSRAVDHWQQ